MGKAHKTSLIDPSGKLAHCTIHVLCLVQVGAVFTMGFSVDAPHLLAVGGAMGSVVVWDVRANQDVAQTFPRLMSQQQ